MHTRISTLRLCTAVATAILLTAGSQPVIADQPPVQLLGVYSVLPGKTNTADHETAEFSVFRSRREPGMQFGLFFLQRKGQYNGDAFVCTDAPYDAANGALSCSKLVTQGGKAFKEVVTVGRLGSDYCKNLATKKNGPSKKIILDVCPQPGGGGGSGKAANPAPRCACYEIEHRCFDKASGKYEAACGGGGSGAGAPPGSGAGSGGSH